LEELAIVPMLVEVVVLPEGMYFAAVQKYALAVDEDRMLVPCNLDFLSAKLPSAKMLAELTTSCSASRLYGMIHSFGEYPTALAALSTAKHDSASAPPSFKKLFMLC
jgi:hypothetical protein